MIYLIDTYAWVEYINGSNKANVLRNLFPNPNSKFITMECCVSELAGFCLKKDVNFGKILKVVKANSVVLPVLTKTWIEAAKIRFELRKEIQHFGLIDAILVSKQRELKCKIISGDTHFKGLKNVVYIGD